MQQNIVRRKLGDGAPFGPRDFVICDEAHNVMDIVQSQFSPKFDKFDMRKIDDVIDSAVLLRCGKDEIREKIRSARDRVTAADGNDMVFAALNDYVSAVGELLPDAEAVRSSLGRKSADRRLDRSERKLMSAADFVIDHADSFTEYTRIIKNAGVDSMIKNDSAGGGSVTFNCINESYLMARAFHANVGAGLFMSATIGDPAAFARELDIRGMAVDEALPVLDNFLDAAYMGNLPNARIIHGKGTGVLRSAVQEELRRCKYVKSFRLGVYGEGESGVTIVEFK